MQMIDIILKKRNGYTLTDEEITYVIDGYVAGKIPDYQMSAFLMAVYFKGMTDMELAQFTQVMAHSGDMADLSAIDGVKVDKHSTGGVGDKTSLILGPMIAACGGKFAKISGRGLGHTGGTIDKLESIPGYMTTLDSATFSNIVNTVGTSIIGQSANIAPADKLIYALRDVTGTVESIPLIASSIMSKKLASGSDAIVLDVKTGSGAFMKTQDAAIELAQKMVAIGEANHRRMVALITSMDRPLGYAIGNALEVIEVLETLKGRGPVDLVNECVELAANMLMLAGKGTLEECRIRALQSLQDGSALQKMRDMIAAQGGDAHIADDYSLFPQAKYSSSLLAKEDGYIVRMNTEACGLASMVLGAGRVVKDAPIDFSAGIKMYKKTGDKVQRGDVIAEFFTNKKEALPEAITRYSTGIDYGYQKPKEQPLVFARITKDGIMKNNI